MVYKQKGATYVRTTSKKTAPRRAKRVSVRRGKGGKKK